MHSLLVEGWSVVFFFFSSRRRHTRSDRDWSSDVCSSDLLGSTREIDALAENSQLRIAIEHTSVDSLPNQRKEDKPFVEALGKLEEEVRGKINSRVCLVTPLVLFQQECLGKISEQ